MLSCYMCKIACYVYLPFGTNAGAKQFSNGVKLLSSLKRTFLCGFWCCMKYYLWKYKIFCKCHISQNNSGSFNFVHMYLCLLFIWLNNWMYYSWSKTRKDGYNQEGVDNGRIWVSSGNDHKMWLGWEDTFPFHTFFSLHCLWNGWLLLKKSFYVTL